MILTRAVADSALGTWGRKLREKLAFKRAAVAVARKLAVIIHAMLKSGESFVPASSATCLSPTTQGVRSPAMT